jgi:hypothetical protein
MPAHANKTRSFSCVDSSKSATGRNRPPRVPRRTTQSRHSRLGKNTTVATLAMHAADLCVKCGICRYASDGATAAPSLALNTLFTGYAALLPWHKKKSRTCHPGVLPFQLQAWQAPCSLPCVCVRARARARVRAWVQGGGERLLHSAVRGARGRTHARTRSLSPSLPPPGTI